MIMTLSSFVVLLGYVFSAFYGSAAVYLVFETRSRCPFRWPLLFGMSGSLGHLAINEVPYWWPPSITKDMIIGLFLLSTLAIGVGFLQRLIREYNIEPPWTVVRRWCREYAEYRSK